MTFDSGLSVQVAAPVRARPSASMDEANVKQINLSLVVTVTNGQPDAFDVAHLVATASTGSNATPCREIRDRASGLGVRGPTPIRSGAKARFTIGYSCPGKQGDALVVEITPRAGFASGQFSGSLP